MSYTQLKKESKYNTIGRTGALIQAEFALVTTEIAVRMQYTM